MKTLFTLPAIALLALTSPALAQETPGEHFMLSYDLDEDGQVTLEEATQRRGEIFAIFDENEDGILSSAEYDTFDDARAADHGGTAQMAPNGGNGNAGAMGKDNGNRGGNGGGNRGHGNGGGNRGGNGGHGNGGGGNQGEGMAREINDANHDGVVSQAEFIGMSNSWFLRRDRNGDGVLTVTDFGPRG